MCHIFSLFMFINLFMSFIIFLPGFSNTVYNDNGAGLYFVSSLTSFLIVVICLLSLYSGLQNHDFLPIVSSTHPCLYFLPFLVWISASIYPLRLGVFLIYKIICSKACCSPSLFLLTCPPFPFPIPTHPC